MKSKMKRRMLAIVLCMVIALSNSSFIFASSGTEEPAAVAQEGDPQNVQEAQTEAAVQDTPAVLSETTPEATPEATPEPTQVPEVTAAPTEAPQATAEPTQAPEVTAAPETTPEATPVPTETPVVTAEPTQAPEITPTPAPEVTEAPEATPEATPVPSETPENSDALIDHETDEQTISPVFEGSFEVEDGSAVVYAKAPEGVFPEGTTFTARRIEAETDEYQTVEESLENEAAKTEKDVLDFVAYDITFSDAEGNEIEPNGNVQVSIDFNNMEFGGVTEENASVDVVHIKDDFTTETIQSDIDTKNEQLNKVEFSAEQFSIYAVTTIGIINRYESSIQANDYAVIEFWDKQTAGGNQPIEFQDSVRDLDSDKRYLKIIVYVENNKKFDNVYILVNDLNEDTFKQQINIQTNVRPGNGYYLQKSCEWEKAGTGDTEYFAGSGSTGMNKAGSEKEYNILKIYLTEHVSQSSDTKITNGIKAVNVDLYNYNSDNYNNYVGVNDDSLLLRSTWNDTYKADGYNNIDSGWNVSSGDYGIYTGLVTGMNKDGIVFNKTAAFFDQAFDQAKASGNDIGTKYENVAFDFKYDSATEKYTYISEDTHVHFDETENAIHQYEGKGPGTISDSDEFSRDGFFPFTDETDNMTKYGFGMRMDVEFYLPESGTIAGNNMQFHFSGDDDVWVFVDGELVLDVGGLHGRRGGTIDFGENTVTYEQATKNGKTDDVVFANDPDKELNGSEYVKQMESVLEKLQRGTTHVLTMYYLERGGNESNCEITFNLPVVTREGTLSFDKVTDNNQPLADAMFGLYETNNITDETIPIATAVSDESGKVVFDISALEVSKTYYLKEISTAWGFELDSNIYIVTLQEQTESSTTDAVEKVIITAQIKDSTGPEIQKIVNKKITTGGGDTSVSVEKEWQEGLTKVPVTVTLQDESGNKINNTVITSCDSGKDNPAELNENNNWKYSWNHLPGSCNYQVKEEVPEGLKAEYAYSSTYTMNPDFTTITPCANTLYNLGRNGVIAIKGKSNWIVWTSVKVSEKNKVNLITGINAGKDNGNALTMSNTTFVSGTVETSLRDQSGKDEQGIKFEYNAENASVVLEFDASKEWSFFLMGTYDESISVKITNTVDENYTIDIPVEKKWLGDQLEYQDQTSVTVQLYRNGIAYGSEEKILKSNNWKYTFTGLPYFYLDDLTGEYKVCEYSVVETKVGDFDVEKAWCEVRYSGTAETGFVITNIYPSRWKIIKVSSTEPKLPLGNAWFSLTKEGEDNPSYVGRSNELDGEVIWAPVDSSGTVIQQVEYIQDGMYILEETSPPSGYEKSTVKWRIRIEDLQLMGIWDYETEESIPYELPKTRAEIVEKIYSYENNPITYNLPSAGGTGIFWYLISGTAFLMAASLILYRMKRKEVLGK